MPSIAPPISGREDAVPYFQDSTITLHHGDCLDVLRSLPGASVDAVVTDPPYGLEFMGKEWDRPDRMGKVSDLGAADGTPFRRNGGTPAWGASGNPACRNCGGQKYGVGKPCRCDSPNFPNHMAMQMRAFQDWCADWATECLRVLKPGGHLLAFGGTRTFHRLACAVEDAGFEVRDGIAWLYGSGFPKSLNLTDDEGERTGWGTALKPAFEPIVVARKPLVGTVAANVLAHGTGALNIDGCRVGSDSTTRVKRGGANDFPHEDDAWTPTVVTVGSDSGRWPANIVLDESQAAELDAQSGTLQSGANPTRRGSDKFREAYGEFAGQAECEPARGADSGGASRFFYVAKADQSERVRVDGVAHPTVKPLDLMRWLVRLVTPPGGIVLEPFAGSGTTVEACILEGFQCIAIERDETYLPLIVQRINRRRDPVAAVKATGDDGGLFDLLGEATA